MEKTRDIAILLPMGCTPQKKEDRVGLPVSTNAINPELLCGGSVVITEQAAQSLTTSHLPVETVDAFFLFEQRVPGAPVLSSFVFLDTTPKKTVLRRCSGQILVASDDKPSEDGFRPMPPFDCVPDYPCGNFVRPHGALKFGRDATQAASGRGSVLSEVSIAGKSGKRSSRWSMTRSPTGRRVLPPSSVATRLRAVVQVRKRPGCAPQ